MGALLSKRNNGIFYRRNIVPDDVSREMELREREEIQNNDVGMHPHQEQHVAEQREAQHIDEEANQLVEENEEQERQPVILRFNPQYIQRIQFDLSHLRVQFYNVRLQRAIPHDQPVFTEEYRVIMFITSEVLVTLASLMRITNRVIQLSDGLEENSPERVAIARQIAETREILRMIDRIVSDHRLGGPVRFHPTRDIGAGDSRED